MAKRLKFKNNTRRWLPLAVMGYMVLALSWWAVLLYRKISETYQIQLSLLKDSAPTLSGSPSELTADYQRDLFMVFGEGIVFIIILALGLYLINKAYFKEIDVAYQKRNFLLSITHELKSPLAGIKLAFQTLNKHNLESKQKKELIDAALDENSRLEKLVNNLLLAAKFEKDYFVEREKVELNAALQQISENFRIKYPDFQFNFSSTKPLYATLDPEGLKSIVYNLIENAIKYSKHNKIIDIEAKESNGVLIISVRDQGIGIPKSERENVFTQFYRIGSEETRETKGTGLGLYIVKKIVEAHNGSIQILENQPNGSIFRIKLPIKINGDN